ncbi:arad-like aldolase/epimerase [Mycena metata]|uniref:Arad-like aldolase/epimerase n=1 Tax=Mycena metata TaxID=1033252 RepID=A0AAD7N361_9AGAR|nr:arad-like aldolase/epimerase [Mycena metata]
MHVYLPATTTVFYVLQALCVVSAQKVPASVLSAAIDLLDASRNVSSLHIHTPSARRRRCVWACLGSKSGEFEPVPDSRTFAIAPALATSQSIVTYEVENATATAAVHADTQNLLRIQSSCWFKLVEDQWRTMTSLWGAFRSTKIFKRFPDVLGVVHSHTQEILPFANQDGVKLVSQIHTAPSVGSEGAPVFDVRKLSKNVLPDNQLHDLDIRTEALGDALARTFSSDSQVVLMRGHRMAVRAPSLREAAFDSFYIKQDATVQLQGILLGGGKAPLGLNKREVTDTATDTSNRLDRAWSLWIGQVDTVELYTNDLRKSTDPD